MKRKNGSPVIRQRTKSLIQRELEQIAKRDSEHVVRPEAVVAFAKSNPRSALHKEFNWNVQEAAEAHWLNQARNIIRVNVVMLESPMATETVIPISEYISLPDRRGQGYERVTDVLSDDDRREAMLRYTIERLLAIKEVNVFTELEEVAAAIAAVASEYLPKKNKGRGKGKGDPLHV